MNISEYRSEVAKYLLQPLADLGFQCKGDHIYLSKGESYLALLRVRDKWSNLTQKVQYLLVVRHSFLPDMEERPITGFVEHAELYPFKANPLKLDRFEKGVFRKKIVYRYSSCNLGRYDTVNIDYGRKFSRETLTLIAREIGSRGMRWLEFLTPEESARQIASYGNSEYAEEIWLTAYEKRGYLV